MIIRGICKELQEVAVEELNEHPERIEEDLQVLREWLLKQPHLNVRLDDQWLIAFLRGCKWSLQRTKEKIDFYYTMRTLVPELFRNRDPFSPVIQSMLKTGVVCPLPNTESVCGPRIIYADYTVMDYNIVRLEDAVKLYFMMIDILMVEDDNFVISGLKLLANFGSVPTPFVLQFTPTLTKKFTICSHKAYPTRAKNYIAINTPVVLEKVYNTLMKPFFSQKLQDRVRLYSSKNKQIYNEVPQYLFPDILNGKNGTRSVLIEHWKNKVESYKDWFAEDEKYMSREELRPKKSKSYTEEFDMEGTFRKLELD